MRKSETKSDVSLELFSGKLQHDAFACMNEVFPTRALQASDKPCQFPEGVPMNLPETYVSEGQVHSREVFLLPPTPPPF